MSPRRPLVRRVARTWAASVAAVLVASLFVGTAHADELRDAVHWNAEVCSAPFYTFAATATDPWNPGYTSHREQVKGAWAGASWMILREGVWNKTMNFSSGCTGAWNGGNWWDNGNELSSGWYETSATVVARCGGLPGAVGCTALDHVFLGSDIIAADITVSRDNNWGVINQDSVTNYLESDPIRNPQCMSFENVWLHELGHAYGLDHTNAQIATMGNGSFCVKNINIPQTYNDQFWPLDNAQMRPLYEIAAGSSTRRNFSVSAFRRISGVDFLDQPGAVFLTTSTPTRSLTVNYSLNRYFAASTGSVRVQFRFVKDGFEPTFNWSTLSWAWPAETSTDLTDVQTTSSGTVDTATTRSFTFNVTRADLPAATGTWYRLWMRVDDTSAWVETEEGDNMVPTRFYVVKS